MVATVNASTSAGVVITPDNSGVLAFQSSSATALTIDASQNSTFVGTASATKLIPTGSSATGNGMYLPAANSLGLSTNGTERMRIDSSGNLGIGTASPSTKLAVAGGISGTGAINISGSGWGVLSYVANSLVIDNNAGESRFFATGADASTDGSFLFYTSQTDGGTNERMRIDSSGNVGIGVTPSYKLSVTSASATSVAVLTNSNGSTPYGMSIIYSGAAPANTDYGFLYCSDTSNQKLVIYSSGTVSNRTGTYNSLSDIKIKQDISDASSQWDDIKAIKFRKYRLIDDVKANTNAPYFLGVVAQELELTSPNLVDEAPDTVRNEDGTIENLGTSTKQVKYSILYMKAVKALQEAMTRIETLETKADTQAATITTLPARIVALENR